MAHESEGAAADDQSSAGSDPMPDGSFDAASAPSLESTAAYGDEQFVKLLTSEQMRLLYYITVIIGDPHAAENILQETNLTLWRKSAEFQRDSNFGAWARRVAYWQTQAYLRDHGRDRHLFSGDFVAELANRNVTAGIDSDTRAALRTCLAKLRPDHVEMLRRRYEDGAATTEIAIELGKTAEAIRAMLMRIRKALQRCIEGALRTAT